MSGYSSIWFNAHHSPLGAFATLTLGYKGSNGGLGLELAQPANEPLYIGHDDDQGHFHAFPFFDGAAALDEAARYDVERDTNEERPSQDIHAFPDDEISRDFRIASDTWTVGDFTFKVISPLQTAPDPNQGSTEDHKLAYCPAVLVELSYDNTKGTQERTLFFGHRGSNPYHNPRVIETDTLIGIGQGSSTAICTTKGQMKTAFEFSPGTALLIDRDSNRQFLVGTTGLLTGKVPAGERKTFTLAACFYRNEVVTTGIESRYYYSSLFDSIEDVADFALQHQDKLKSQASTDDYALETSDLTDTRKFLVAQAARSYQGCTQLLMHQDGRPLWVVHEGEYRMMNTFDLTVDHLYFETQRNPWVVKNVLQLFVDRYSYEDQVQFPGDPTQHPGGISFTHDMGVGNQFTRPGYSSYELAGIKGCFSYMTQEQLVNWICSLAYYCRKTNDWAFAESLKETVQATLSSMENRDHPDPEKRNGIMSLDSSRCEGGAEITTYDSLDASLGQARNNVYLAVKGWAAYLGLADIFTKLNLPEEAARAQSQAEKAAKSITCALQENGTIPAVLGEGVNAVILPAIEGLAFPLEWGDREAVCKDGPYGPMIKALEVHLRTALTSGKNHFADGAWKLSSTSNNSWLSKIFLNQHVAHHVFNIPLQEMVAADQAHADWLTDEQNGYWAFSDQILSGHAVGSKYYPRGVTNWLWLTRPTTPGSED